MRVGRRAASRTRKANGNRRTYGRRDRTDRPDQPEPSAQKVKWDQARARFKSARLRADAAAPERIMFATNTDQSDQTDQTAPTKSLFILSGSS